MIKGGAGIEDDPFEFSWRSVCLTYAFIGFMLALVQGGIVRRLAGRFPEGPLAAFGAATEIVGFGLVVFATMCGSTAWLFVALGVIVVGFSFMQPNLNSLLSRRSDPARQGLVLGVGQSVSSLARILGSGLGIPLLKLQWYAPYGMAAVLMALGVVVVTVAARGGGDFEAGG